MKLDAMLWAGILISPIVWFLDLEANFALAPLACSGGGKPALYFVSVISLIVVGAAAGLSWVQWHSLEQEPAGQTTRTVQRYVAVVACEPAVRGHRLPIRVGNE